MKAFTYQRATSPAQAAQLVARTPNARFIAGGTNLLDLMKLEIETPTALVDVNGLGFDQIEATADGAELSGVPCARPPAAWSSGRLSVRPGSGRAPSPVPTAMCRSRSPGPSGSPTRSPAPSARRPRRPASSSASTAGRGST